MIFETSPPQEPAKPIADIELEQHLLGLFLVRNDVLILLPADFSPETFYEPLHQEIFKKMLLKAAKDEAFSPLTLKNLIDDNLIENGYLIKLAANYFYITDPQTAAKQLIDLHNRRNIIDICKKTILQASKIDSDELAGEIVANAANQLQGMETAQRFRISTERQVTERLLLKAQENPTEFSKTGFDKLDFSMGGGLFAGKLYGLVGRKKMGKAQPLNSKILTLDGWVNMGDLKIGEEVASIDGKKSIVNGIFPQGEKDIYEIIFSDGRKARCCKEHLWNVFDYRHKCWKTINTEKMMEWLKLDMPFYIPLFSGEYGVHKDLPIDAYILGCLLGDGGISQKNVNLTSADEGILIEFEKRLPDHLTLSSVNGKYDFRIKNKQKKNTNSLKEELDKLGLMGKNSETKFIPEIYLNSSFNQRVDLINGLLDTDGWARAKGAEFCTVSKDLAYKMQYLIRSIGGICTIKEKVTSYSYNGIKKQGKLAYRCFIRHPEPSILFKLSRKKCAFEKRTNGCRLNVVEINLIGIEESQCISVSHDSHLYITDDFIVTHNTMLAGSISHNLQASGQRHMYLALEMGSDEIHQRSLARQIGCNEEVFRLGVHKSLQLKIAEYVNYAKNYRLYLDAPSLGFDDLRHLLPQYIKKYNLKGFILDSWQLVQGKRKGQSTAEHLDEVAQYLAEVCKKYSVWGVATAQENQDENTRGGEGLRLAVDQLYRICKKDVEDVEAWLEMMETRYTRWQNVGEENNPSLLMASGGTHYEAI